LGNWEIGKLGNWEIGKLGNWEIIMMLHKYYNRTSTNIILMLLFSLKSTSIQANDIASPALSILQLTPIDHIIAYLIAGFSLGIIVYNCVIFCCTHETIYLRFSAALFGFIIGIGQHNMLWHITVWPQAFVITLLDTLNMILFIAFSKHFLVLFVDFKRSHPLITRIMDIYTILGVILIISTLLFSSSALQVIKDILITSAALTCIITAPNWYNTIKHLRSFVYTIMLFCLTQVYFHLHTFITDSRVDSLSAQNVVFFSGALLFMSFSLLITNRLNNDRKQRDSAQNTAIYNLQKYQTLYENALEGLFTVRYDGRILATNPALKNLLNLPSDLHTLDNPAPFLHNYFAQPQSVWSTVMQQLEQKKIIQTTDVQGQGNTWYSLSLRKVSTDTRMILEGSLTDITQRKQQELQLAYLASHDPLTNLYNRTEFENYLQDAISSQSAHILLFIDLDQFKVINDTCGHAAGDECLRQITAVFKLHISSHDMLARLGGDEFGIILWNQSPEQGMESAERLRQALEANHFQWLLRLFKTTISIGLIAINKTIDCGAQALSLADAACYEAKDAGRNRIVINDPNKHTTLYRHNQMDMVATLTQALRDQHLILFQQLITPLNTSSTEPPYSEVLIRLQTEHGLLNPGAFLPAAQRYNMLSQIDRWVFNKTCQWLSEGDNLHNTGMVNVNLSPQTLSDPTFMTFINQNLASYRIPAQKICFEITEYSALNNFTRVLHHIYTLRDLGFSFALDDFGSGFASFDHVRRLPVDIIKIDGQFIRNINQDINNKTMVSAITDIAHNLGKKVIAEWVEDAATLETLCQLGVDFGQGYFLGMPKPLYDYHPVAIPTDYVRQSRGAIKLLQA